LRRSSKRGSTGGSERRRFSQIEDEAAGGRLCDALLRLPERFEHIENPQHVEPLFDDARSLQNLGGRQPSLSAESSLHGLDGPSRHQIEIAGQRPGLRDEDEVLLGAQDEVRTSQTGNLADELRIAELA